MWRKNIVACLRPRARGPQAAAVKSALAPFLRIVTLGLAPLQLNFTDPPFPVHVTSGNAGAPSLELVGASWRAGQQHAPPSLHWHARAWRQPVSLWQ